MITYCSDLSCVQSEALWNGVVVQPGKEAGSAHSFWKEAEMLASLNHPNVLRVYGVVVADAPSGLESLGSPVDRPVVGIMTEYMRGGSLSAHLAQLAT